MYTIYSWKSLKVLFGSYWYSDTWVTYTQCISSMRYLLVTYLCNTVFKSIKKYCIESRKSMIEYH